MKLLPICSSSKGNSAYIGSRDSGILIDVGCSYKALCQGLAAMGTEIGAVKAVLITHSHSDHVKGLLTMTKKNSIPIFGAQATLDYLLQNEQVAEAAELHTLDDLNNVQFDGEIRAFPTPHDCEGSVGYVMDIGGERLGYCTDLGKVTDEVRKNLLGCRTVFIEANYEPELLRGNPRYPAYLKQRIASDHGHLSNPDSAEFCSELVKSGTVNLVLGHLSQENNTPRTAFKIVSERLARDGAQCERDYVLRVAEVSNSTGEYVVV